MKAIHAFARSVSNLAMLAAVAVLLGMTGLILVEAFLRTFFSMSTYAADEMVGYGIGAMSFLALGQSLEKRTLIRMNLLIANINPTGRPRQIIEALCILFAFFSCGLALFYFARNVLRNFDRGYVSETILQMPLWIPESFIVVGLAVFLLQLLSHLLLLLSGSLDLSAEKSAELSAD